MVGSLAREESGMTMGLAIMTMVLVGVMGAGLLTLVAADLNAVAEVNRGQRAFEMADLGIRVAGLQLRSDPEPGRYDGGAGDVPWSAARGGVSLNDLDDSAATADSATVFVEHVSSTGQFRVVSDGRYGDARRRIEAFFEETDVSNAIRAYYTPGDIHIESSNQDGAIKGVSFFSGRNILLEGFSFADHGEAAASVKIGTGVADALGDWNTADDSPPANWNTVRREIGPAGGVPLTEVGFAAEGYICGSTDCPEPDPDPDVIAATDGSIADGVYGYDRTTGTIGNGLRFSRAPNLADETPASGVITYPFSLEGPNVEALLERASSGAPNAYVDASGPYDFDEIYATDEPRVVFVDSHGGDVRLSMDDASRNPSGIIVVRCGNLTIKDVRFTGIVLVLDGGADRDCGADAGTSRYRAENAHVRGYVYAEGVEEDALHIDSRSRVGRLPDEEEYEEFMDLAWSSGDVRLIRWRELYQ